MINLDLFSDEYPAQPVLPFKLPDSPGFSYLWDERRNAYVITVPNGKLVFYETFFGKKVCDRTIEYFLENETRIIPSYDCRDINPENIQWRNVGWQQDSIQMYGKSILLPRLSAWYGESGMSYSYSGIMLEPNPWNKGLLYIKDKIEQTENVLFNSVLLNWYRDGNDHISWHSDAEKELGKNPIVGSVNFGETRRFLLRRIENHDEKVEISLKNGSFLIMSGELQHFWQHSVPKQKSVNGSRFNLTFRTIKNKTL
ncbi:MAG: alkylated DNA repair dioxygenase AlkB [Phenylobacterium sp.]|jgi:alkylated DNA repair dioxygenase AlkB